MSKIERIYALLVEANPVPDPEALPERLGATEPHLSVVDPRRAPMKTEETMESTKTTKQRALIPALGAAAVIVAAVAIGALLLADVGQPSAEEARNEAAVAAAEAQMIAINNGDTASVIVTTPDDGHGPKDEADGRLLDYNVAFTSVYPWQIQGCEATFASEEYVNVDCSLVNTDPVFVAEGVSELIAPHFVYDDGRIVARPWQGANFSLANGTYAEYLRLNHRSEYDAVCWAPAYATGTVNHVGGMAFTAECAALALPLAEDIAEWVRLAKPGT